MDLLLWLVILQLFSLSIILKKNWLIAKSIKCQNITTHPFFKKSYFMYKLLFLVQWTYCVSHMSGEFYPGIPYKIYYTKA